MGTAWVVELENNVWLCVGKGDPCRTLDLDKAFRFSSEAKATSNLRMARMFHPFSNAKITQVIE